MESRRLESLSKCSFGFAATAAVGLGDHQLIRLFARRWIPEGLAGLRLLLLLVRVERFLARRMRVGRAGVPPALGSSSIRSIVVLCDMRDFKLEAHVRGRRRAMTSCYQSSCYQSSSAAAGVSGMRDCSDRWIATRASLSKISNPRWPYASLR